MTNKLFAIAGILLGILGTILFQRLDRAEPKTQIMSASQEFITDKIVLDKTDSTVSLTCVQ